MRMTKTNLKVLVVATSGKTRGGIASVVNGYMKGYIWQKYSCRWIETQIDRNVFFKLLYLVRAYVEFFIFIPFYDIVHFHTVPGNCTTIHLPLLRLAVFYKKKVIVHLHIGDQLHNYCDDKKFREVLDRADMLIAISKMASMVLEDVYKIDSQVRVLYNASPVVNDKGDAGKEKIILVAGILDKNKAYDIILKAFAFVSKEFRDWKLVFAGNGDVDKAGDIARNLKISESVVFTGWLNGEEKAALFKKAEIYCLASYMEGFPVSVLEAWKYILPVICTTAGGLSDVVVDGFNAMVFDRGDISGLAEKMRLLMSDTDLRSSIAANSFDLVNELFSMDEILRQLDVIYTDLAG